MKKQFFYAALAIVLMSSCSKDNEPVNTTDPTPENPGVIDETKPVAIELGISKPTIAATRGTGSVGGTGVAGDDNNWFGQKLNIFMVEQGAEMKGAMEGPNDNQTYIFKDLTFTAPITGSSDKIVVTGTPENIKYFPLTGKYDFYGYHVDATDAATTWTPETGGNIVVTATIDGTNDVMAAKAELTTAQKNEGEGATSGEGKLVPADYAKAFSAWTARRGVQPTLKFKHMLTRLKFNMKAGEDKAAKDYYTGGKEIEAHKFEGETTGNDMTDGAVYIKSITLTGQKSGITLTIKPDGNELTASDAATDFNLKERVTDPVPTSAGELTTLTPTAVEAFSTPTAIGESMMVFPEQESFLVTIDVAQYVPIHEVWDETLGSMKPDKYAWKTNTMKDVVVLAPKTMPNPEPGQTGSVDSTDKNAAGNFIFAQGKSYNINITVYGFQRIDITAELEGWISGDDVEVNPGDDI